MRTLLLASLLALPAFAADPPPTLRVDIQHAGDANTETFALERIVVEPLPWPGNPARPLDDTNRGVNLLRVRDAASGELLYSRGYSTLFGEWQSTAEAGELQRSFQESLRFPMPDAPVVVEILERGEDNAWVPAWQVPVDPAALHVERAVAPPPATPVAIRENGPPSNKVDLLILGDGYAADELHKFEADARRLADHLFSVSPFREREQDFNVWALTVPLPQSGVSRPSTGVHKASATGLRYDIFGSERYALSVDNRAWRELAQHAPYDVVEIIFNSETYGGGGIFGQFSTAAASNEWADYLFVHEFGHHFAGLADEYYTSAVAYESGGERPEPWEPNATADPHGGKWRHLVSQAVPVPTPWPKADFEAFQRKNQARRAQLRADDRPEAEMSQLFRDEQAFVTRLFRPERHNDVVGAFEGANYQATGYYRPQMNCLMFTRTDHFCDVCAEAIERIIDLYAAH